MAEIGSSSRRRPGTQHAIDLNLKGHTHDQIAPLIDTRLTRKQVQNKLLVVSKTKVKESGNINQEHVIRKSSQRQHRRFVIL